MKRKYVRINVQLEEKNPCVVFDDLTWLTNDIYVCMYQFHIIQKKEIPASMVQDRLTKKNDCFFLFEFVFHGRLVKKNVRKKASSFT
jgi:hypothetical protein